MGTEAPTPIVIPIHCAPKKAPCPKCGKRGRRKRAVTRRVRTVAYYYSSRLFPHDSPATAKLCLSPRFMETRA
jgi:hypothetical protein